ncbi:MAG TPA: threonine synthase [Rhizomicrobium sp.]|nr:threonine synthase [Rhizomicrobium sp.]
MHYLSTRGAAKPHSFGSVLLGGLAPDGGLFMPDFWPRIPADEIASYAKLSYQDVAFRVLSRFAGASFAADDLKADIAAAYASFEAPEIAPLVAIGPNLHLLELFHGPTLAFKDIAMQLLGRLFARKLAQRGGRATILAATSGDTGSAAIAAFGDLPNIELFVLHPHGRVSEVQRRQMTAAPFANVHNIALEGSFDDAQAIVKSLFADRDFAARAHLTAVNSINFVRIAAQCVYYFTATAKLGVPPFFVVPTGNFGDVFAGEAAMHMGLGIERLVVATNANDIIARALNEGVYAAGQARPTLSPSMDIQIASNFERALFEASGRDTGWVTQAMTTFAQTRRLALPRPVLTALRARYSAHAVDDAETLTTIKRVHAETGRLIDPHTAVGVAATRKIKAGKHVPVVVLSTAHPAKFPDALVQATGISCPLPERLSALYENEERATVLANDGGAVRSFIETRLPHP